MVATRKVSEVSTAEVARMIAGPDERVQDAVANRLGHSDVPAALIDQHAIVDRETPDWHENCPTWQRASLRLV